jgi:hypothetical protein
MILLYMILLYMILLYMIQSTQLISAVELFKLLPFPSFRLSDLAGALCRHTHTNTVRYEYVRRGE